MDRSPDKQPQSGVIPFRRPGVSASNSQNVSRSSLSSGFDYVDEEFNDVASTQLQLPEEPVSQVHKTPKQTQNSKTSFKSSGNQMLFTDLSISTWKRINHRDINKSRLHTITSGSLLGADGKPYFFENSKPTEFDSRIFFPESDKTKKSKRVVIERDLELDLNSEEKLRTSQQQQSLERQSTQPSIKLNLAASSRLQTIDFYRTEQGEGHFFGGVNFGLAGVHKAPAWLSQDKGIQNSLSEKSRQQVPGYRFAKRPSRHALFGLSTQPTEESSPTAGLEIIPLGNAKRKQEQSSLPDHRLTVQSPKSPPIKKGKRVRLLITGQGLNASIGVEKTAGHAESGPLDKEEKQEFGIKSPRCSTLPSEPILPSRKWIDLSFHAPRIPEWKNRSVLTSDRPQTAAKFAKEDPNPKSELSAAPRQRVDDAIKALIIGGQRPQITEKDSRIKNPAKSSSVLQTFVTEIPILAPSKNSRRSTIQIGENCGPSDVPGEMQQSTQSPLPRRKSTTSRVTLPTPYLVAPSIPVVQKAAFDSRRFLLVQGPSLAPLAARSVDLKAKQPSQAAAPIAPVKSETNSDKTKELVRLFRKVSEFNRAEHTGDVKASISKPLLDKSPSNQAYKVSQAQVVSLRHTAKLPKPFRVLRDFPGNPLSHGATAQSLQL